MGLLFSTQAHAIEFDKRITQTKKGFINKTKEQLEKIKAKAS